LSATLTGGLDARSETARADHSPFCSVCVASIVRIYYLNGLSTHLDASWWMGPSFAWSSIEPSVAIIAACLPTFAPLFRAWREKATGASGSGGYGGQSRGMPSGPHGAYGLGSLAKTNNGVMRMEEWDDEAQLTTRIAANDGRSSRQGAESEDSNDFDRGIVVKTQVQVTSREGNARNTHHF
jgi:hypothetical protein